MITQDGGLPIWYKTSTDWLYSKLVTSDEASNSILLLAHCQIKEKKRKKKRITLTIHWSYGPTALSQVYPLPKWEILFVENWKYRAAVVDVLIPMSMPSVVVLFLIHEVCHLGYWKRKELTTILTPPPGGLFPMSLLDPPSRIFRVEEGKSRRPWTKAPHSNMRGVLRQLALQKSGNPSSRIPKTVYPQLLPFFFFFFFFWIILTNNLNQ